MNIFRINSNNSKECKKCNETKDLLCFEAHTIKKKKKDRIIIDDICKECISLDSIPDEKRCSKCGVIKDKDKFSVRSDKKNGKDIKRLCSQCKDCRSDSRRFNRDNQKEKLKELLEDNKILRKDNEMYKKRLKDIWDLIK